MVINGILFKQVEELLKFSLKVAMEVVDWLCS